MVYYIKSSEWKAIYSVLGTIKGIHKKNEDRLRLFIEAVWYVMRSGCQWRLVPCHYGSWRAIHSRLKSWAERGIWQVLFERVQTDRDVEAMMIDTTAHACAAGYGRDGQSEQALGRSKGGFTTKIHTLVDALGNPLKFILTPGQRHDMTQANNLTQGIEKTTLIADKGYDSQAFIDTLQTRGCQTLIPSRKNRKEPRAYDLHLYKECHLIECFFSKIKQYRRIFSRFDKAASTYLAFLHFVGTLIWLK